MSEPRKYGFYSKMGAEQYGSSIYSTPSGAEVEVTCVCNGPKHGEGWEDLEPRGEVVKFLRLGRIGNPPQDGPPLPWELR